jgi:hypothetical protein
MKLNEQLVESLKQLVSDFDEVIDDVAPYKTITQELYKLVESIEFPAESFFAYLSSGKYADPKIQSLVAHTALLIGEFETDQRNLENANTYLLQALNKYMAIRQTDLESYEIRALQLLVGNLCTLSQLKQEVANIILSLHKKPLISSDASEWYSYQATLQLHHTLFNQIYFFYIRYKGYIEKLPKDLVKIFADVQFFCACKVEKVRRQPILKQEISHAPFSFETALFLYQLSRQQDEAPSVQELISLKVEIDGLIKQNKLQEAKKQYIKYKKYLENSIQDPTAGRANLLLLAEITFSLGKAFIHEEISKEAIECCQMCIIFYTKLRGPDELQPIQELECLYYVSLGSDPHRAKKCLEYNPYFKFFTHEQSKIFIRMALNSVQSPEEAIEYFELLLISYQKRRSGKQNPTKNELICLYHLIANLANVGRIAEAKNIHQKYSNDNQELSEEVKECLQGANIVMDNYSIDRAIRMKEVSKVLKEISHVLLKAGRYLQPVKAFKPWDESGFIDNDGIMLYTLTTAENDKKLTCQMMAYIKGVSTTAQPSTGLSPIGRGLLICICLRYLNQLVDLHDINDDITSSNNPPFMKYLARSIYSLFYHKTTDDQQQAIVEVVNELLELPDLEHIIKTSLIVASSAKHGLIDLLQLLLDRFGFHRDPDISGGLPPLVCAITAGNLACVQYLCRDQAEANVELDCDGDGGDLRGYSPLMVAITYGRIEITHYLIEKCHAAIEQTIRADTVYRSYTALMIAIMEGKKEEVIYLLDKGANISFRLFQIINKEQQTLSWLQFVKSTGQHHIVKLLHNRLVSAVLESESDRQLTDEEVEQHHGNCLQQIENLILSKENKVVDNFIDEKFPVDLGSLDNLSVASLALLAYRSLLIAGCHQLSNKNTSYFNSFMSLYHIANEAGKKDEFIRELSHKLELLPQFVYYASPVIAAILRKRDDVLVLLLDELKQDFTHSAKTLLGEITPLAVAISIKYFKATQILSDRLGDIDAFAGISSSIPLMFACSLKSTPSKIVEYLLRRGADLNKAIEHHGEMVTPFIIALRQSTVSIIKILVWYGADLQQPLGRHKLSPIAIAALHGNAEIVGFLINKGVDFISKVPPYTKTLLELFFERTQEINGVRPDYSEKYAITMGILKRATVTHYTQLADACAATEQLQLAIENYDKAIIASQLDLGSKFLKCKEKEIIQNSNKHLVNKQILIKSYTIDSDADPQAAINELKDKKIALQSFEEIISQIRKNGVHNITFGWNKDDIKDSNIRFEINDPKTLNLISMQLKNAQINYEVSDEKLIKINNLILIDRKLLEKAFKNVKEACKNRQFSESSTLVPVVYIKNNDNHNNSTHRMDDKFSSQPLSEDEMNVILGNALKARNNKISGLGSSKKISKKEKNESSVNSSAAISQAKNIVATKNLFHANNDQPAIENITGQVNTLNSTVIARPVCTYDSFDNDFTVYQKEKSDITKEKGAKKSKKKKIQNQHKKKLSLQGDDNMQRLAALKCAKEAADRIVVNFLNEYSTDIKKLAHVDQQVRHYGILLGIICTFKALLQYGRLGGKSITVDDSTASDLRNIIHCFDQIKHGDEALEAVAFAIRNQLLPSIRYRLEGGEAAHQLTVALTRGCYATLIAKLQPDIVRKPQEIFKILNKLARRIQGFMKPFDSVLRHELTSKMDSSLYLQRWDASKACLAFIGEVYNKLRRAYPAELQRMSKDLIAFLEEGVFTVRNPIAHEVDDGDIYSLGIPCAFDEVDDLVLYEQVKRLESFKSELASLDTMSKKNKQKTAPLKWRQPNKTIADTRLSSQPLNTNHAPEAPANVQAHQTTNHLGSASSSHKPLNPNAASFVPRFWSANSPQQSFAVAGSVQCKPG